MTIIQHNQTSPGRYPSTAAPGFHLSDTLDWSSLFVQIKNQVIILPAYTLLAKPEIRKFNSPSVKKSDPPETSQLP